jgi:prephenate dehydrogenase
VIGLIGYGRFGRLAARHLGRDFAVGVYEPALSPGERLPSGVTAVSFEAAARSAVLILAVPISALRAVLRRAAPLVRRGALVVDVCSVKAWPALWMRCLLPAAAEILATHPMFGPDSAADDLQGRSIVLCRERVGERRYVRIRTYLAAKGLTVIETDPRAHDTQAAVSLSLTHFIGRALEAYGAQPLAIDTEGYRRLLNILEVVTHDTRELFRDMHRYNPYAGGERRAFAEALARVERDLRRERGR